MFDIIGDIHGHVGMLEKLLKKLSYVKTNNVFRHPNRQAVFTGDLIDRGPTVKETLRIVRNMVESGSAIAVLGNHEYNLICYFTRCEYNGAFLRPHSAKQIYHHSATLADFVFRENELASHIEWMRTLPLFYENENIRVVHASWITKHVEYLKGKLNTNKISSDFLQKSSIKGNYEWEIIEDLLKGIEITLPEKIKIQGGDGKYRRNLRIKWWGDKNLKTYKQLAFLYHEDLPDMLVPSAKLNGLYEYPVSESPVFCGHYWLSGEPTILRENICCLDYGIAKGGKLVAYRWDGEQKLSNIKFVFVEP